MSVHDKRGPGVIVSGVWPPIPIDEWQLTMDPRKVEEFTKKWKKDMKAALRELDGSVGSPDQGTKSQPRIRSEKAAPHLPPPSEFPLDFATPQQRVRVDKAAPHLPSATELPLDLAMKLEERFENDSELAHPVVDESDRAPPTEHKPMKIEKQKKPAPPPATARSARRKPKSVPPLTEDDVAQGPTRIEGACGQRHEEYQEEERRAWGKLEQADETCGGIG